MRVGLIPNNSRRAHDEGWLRKMVERIGGCNCKPQEWHFNYEVNHYSCLNSIHTVAVSEIEKIAGLDRVILERLGLAG